MAKGMKDSSRGQGGSKTQPPGKGGSKGDRGLGSAQGGPGEIQREKGLGSAARESGEFKDTGGFGGRDRPKLGKDLPKKGCLPKLFMLSLPLIIVVAYWSLSF
jgi:hypothetical protein